jgi:hypothetical protein
MVIASECKSRLEASPVGRIGLSVISALALVVVMSDYPALAQLDPRCSNRQATGKFDCTIRKPVVNRAETVHRDIVFAPGDTVYVNADGCVQTSGAGIGSGATWKRYVNPSGADSDHLYHGLVRIPTARLAGTDVGNSLTRIKNVVGRPLTVTGVMPGRDVPPSELVLHLGYEDDDLNDNSYNDHDDGTEDQCKGDGVGNDESEDGPAHVTVTICRGVGCLPKPSRYPFDVVSNNSDPNGFLLNPHWSWQDRPGNLGKLPDTSSCHEFSKHDVGRFWYKPNFPDCTDQAGLEDVDLPDGTTNERACRFNKIYDALKELWNSGGTSINSTLDDLLTGGIEPNFPGPTGNDSFIGHVNWFPITIEGRVAGTVHHERYSDDDYDFSLTCDGQIAPTCSQEDSLYLNGRPYMHVEFDSDETIDHFGTDAWVDLRANVDSGTVETASRHFVGHTIVTGLFGLDGEHRLKSELHPVYAMATRLDENAGDLDDEVWLMFVRNRGDEGGCSSRIWDGGFQDYTFRLPWREGMTSVEVNLDKTQFEGTAGTSPPTVQVVAPGSSSTTELPSNIIARTVPSVANSGDLASSAGIHVAETAVYVTFHLGNIVPIPGAGVTWGPSASVPFIDGALHLKWMGPPGSSGRSGAGGLAHLVARAAGNTTGDDESKDILAAAVSRLPARQQKLMKRARTVGGASLVLHRLGPIGPVKVLTAPPATGVRAASTRPHEPVAGRAGPATGKLSRDAAQMRALCAASNNAPYGLPPEGCKASGHDHRRPPATPARDHRLPTVRDHR